MKRPLPCRQESAVRRLVNANLIDDVLFAVFLYRIHYHEKLQNRQNEGMSILLALSREFSVKRDQV